MGTTGARAARLKAALQELGYRPAVGPPSPRASTLAADAVKAIRSVYWALGGIQSDPVLRPGGWDLSFEGGLVVELDEQLHFNRYRAASLDHSSTWDLPWLNDYRDQMIDGEARCLSDSLAFVKKWTNAGAERQFGPASVLGDLAGNGAPRWKQRALYDFMKDAAAATDGVTLARISIYDEVGGVTLDAALNPRSRADLDLGGLATLVESRVSR